MSKMLSKDNIEIIKGYKTWDLLIGYEEEEAYFSFDFEIQYCPFCGIKLSTTEVEGKE